MSEFSLRNHIHYMPSQQHIECCTASSSLLAVETMLSIANKRINFSRLFLYYMTRKLQGRLGQKGAELKYAMEALSQFGVCTNQKWPLTIDRVNREPDIVALQDAGNYKVTSYKVASPDQYKEYLNNGIPIIIGMLVSKKFWTIKGPFEEHAYRPTNKTDNRPIRGHAVTIVGYNDDMNSGSWIVGNSLGPKWGSYGYGAIPYECKNDIMESYVITEFPGIPLGKKIS
jgi:C1A family cysteine protease